VLVLILQKADLMRILSRSFQIATLIIGIISGIAAIYISNNFYEVFVKFHLLFFHNDYWILDPKTDLMINILPEGFFFDTVKMIGMTFGIILSILLILSVIARFIWVRREKKA
jgi:integral membrane protein (TIGR01906 family)